MRRGMIGGLAAAMVSLQSQAAEDADRYAFAAVAAAGDAAREIVEALVGDRSPLAQPCHIYVAPDSKGADVLVPEALDQLSEAVIAALQGSSYGKGCGSTEPIFLSRPKAPADNVKGLIQHLSGEGAKGVVLSLAYYRPGDVVVLGRLDDIERGIVSSTGLRPLRQTKPVATAEPEAPNQEMERVEAALQALVEAETATPNARTRSTATSIADRVAAPHESEAAAVTPFTSDKPLDASPTATTTRRYRVQLAALRDEADAHRMWHNLRAEISSILTGVEPYFERVETESGIIYQVHVGLFQSHDEATDLCVQLKNRDADCFVVSR